VKTVILAGGLGSRLAEETVRVPKPMVEIGGFPILWHIMKIYGFHGYSQFIIAAGYKGPVIKDFFDRFYALNTDWSLSLQSGQRTIWSESVPAWDVSVFDTGLETATGGRLRRLRRWLEDGTFMATYGDGVASIDLAALLHFHRQHGRLATLTAVRPIARFGSIDLDGDQVAQFSEKEQGREGWINGGFFVFEPAVLDLVAGDNVSLEHGLLARLCADGQLMAYRHEGFWHPMDTMRDRKHLEELWLAGRAPWKLWPD